MHILFLCVANSARSQMAEGLARALLPSTYKIASAGSSPTFPNPYAIAAMKKISIDISAHTSDALADINLDDVDMVITLCQDEICPVTDSKAKHLHWPFEDPASASGSEDAVLKKFEEIRDKIQKKLLAHFELDQV